MTRLKYFGTDGIRGEVGVYPIVPDFMLKLGQVLGKVMLERGAKSCFLGKDTRVSGYMFESALEAGLSSVGMHTVLLGPVPTPAVSFLMNWSVEDRAFGIVVSASHNPYQDNGIKIFDVDGGKLPYHIEKEIENLLAKPVQVSKIIGKVRRWDEAAVHYINFCRQQVLQKRYPTDFLQGVKIAIDCANGATYRFAPHILQSLGAHVIPYHVSPDGHNINNACGATYPEVIASEVITHKADLGVALDGDGDRAILVDDCGTVLDGDDILYTLALSKTLSMHPVVVGTIMSNHGLSFTLRKHNIDLRRSDVGDRNVMELLIQEGMVLGGEPSGHIIHRDKMVSGDGIISTLLFLHEMYTRDVKSSDLGLGKHKLTQTKLNLQLTRSKGEILEDTPDFLEKIKQDTELKLNKQGRLVLRLSGTEPVLRVMVEMKDEQRSSQIAQGIAADLKKQGITA